jgi:hypothetical protein
MEVRMPMRTLTALAALIAVVLLAVLAAAPAGHAQTPGYTQVSAGYRHTCGLKADGSIECWGDNFTGQAKDQAGSFLQVTADTEHSCAITNNGQPGKGPVHCWGYNDEGQTSPPAGDFIQISAGEDYSCGVTAAGNVDCWGSNYYGQARDQTGPYLQVSASVSHACGLKGDGSVHCWGADYYGETAGRTGPYSQVSAGGFHTCAIARDTGAVECWGAGTTDTGFKMNYGQSMPPAGTFVQVSAGHLFTCGVRSDHTLACWGYNFYGQVKRAPAGTFKQVSAGLGGHACAISDLNEVYCWGKNDAWQARVPNTGGPAGEAPFDFEGFYSPVKPDPTLNMVKAGSSVPLKFSLGGDQGLEILAAGSPASAPLDCATLNPGDDYLPAKSAGGSGLSYDPASGQYSYVWKTEKAWAGTCRVLSLRLADETEHLAAFKFK